MRTGNRKAAFDILVALESLINSTVTDDDAFREELIVLLPKMFDRSPVSTNNFRAFYINDARFDRLKNITVLERRWEDKNGKSYTRTTKRMTNRRLVQRALDDLGEDGFEEREDYSLQNALVREMKYRGISPFHLIRETNPVGEKKKFLIPVGWKKGIEKYVID